ncbi:MAG: oligosaccharide flippase family protein, partial [Elusimicrobia bacterium]|nr:oligosaccharide flippase family protein [Elusimicrobiota bacterium]
MALSIWIARVLGPDNLGLLVLIFAIINYSDEFGRMGIDHAAIYVWGKKEAQFSQLRRHVFLIATIQAAICIAIFIIFRKPLMSALFKQHDLSLRWYALTLANIPLAIYLIYARKLLLAKQTLWAYNATLWSAPLCQLTLLALTKLAGVALTIGWVLAANLAGQIIVVVWSYCEILKLDPTPAGPLNSHLVKNLFRRGLQMYLLNAVSFLQKRFDLIIVAYLLEPKAIAFYSLASTASQMLWKIHSSVGTLFYTVTTEMKVADAAGFASNVYRHLAFLLTIAAALAAVMIGPAVRLLYGA